MSSAPRGRLALAAFAGFLACGLPLWPIPYRKVSLPGNPSPITWLLLGGLAGGFAAWLLAPRWRAAVLAVAAGFGGAVLARVAVETSRDSTSHNLWPFELVIAGFFGLASGALGVFVFRRLDRRAPAG